MSTSFLDNKGRILDMETQMEEAEEAKEETNNPDDIKRYDRFIDATKNTIEGLKNADKE